MKLSKKLATLFLAVTLVIGTSATVFATPNDDIITALQDSKVPQTYIIQAENYLKTTTVTSAQAAIVDVQIKDAAAIVKRVGVISNLSAADKSKLIADVSAAGKAMGLTVSATKMSNGQYEIVAKDAAGNIVFSISSNQVKQTGMDTTIIYVGALMIMLAVGSVFILRKKNSECIA